MMASTVSSMSLRVRDIKKNLRNGKRARQGARLRLRARCPRHRARAEGL